MAVQPSERNLTDENHACRRQEIISTGSLPMGCNLSSARNHLQTGTQVCREKMKMKKGQKDFTVSITVIVLTFAFVLIGGVVNSSAQDAMAESVSKPAAKAARKGSATQTQKSLYERLGGYEAISAVVDRFAEKLFNDPTVGAFFKGMGTDTRNQFKQKNKNLVCNVTGGPCKVISRTAKEAHAGLGITEKDFGIVAGHLVDTLNEFKVPEREQKDLIAIILTLKPDIVEKK